MICKRMSRFFALSHILVAIACVGFNDLSIINNVTKTVEQNKVDGSFI